MKYNSGNFFQVQKKLFEYELSAGAFRLYVTLVMLEHRFTSGKSENEFFLRTDDQLAKDSQCSFNSLRKYKKELIDKGLIKVGIGHYEKDNGTKSAGICSYRIKTL